MRTCDNLTGLSQRFLLTTDVVTATDYKCSHMCKSPNMQITKAELEIMHVLWDVSGLGATEIHAKLKAETSWSIRTVKTLLSRLTEKGALATTQHGRKFHYAPLVSQHDYQASAAGQFIDRVFSGRAAPLVAHLADTRGLTDEDIAELETLIGKLKS